MTVAYGATVPMLDSLGIFYARDQGIFKKYGLNVHVMMLNGDIKGLQAVIGGQAEAGFVSNQSLYEAIEKGANLRGFVQLANKQDYVLVANNKVKTLLGLQGHILGTSGPGGIAEVVPFLALKLAGGNTSKVTEVNVGGTGARLKSLVSGTTDAGIAHYVDAEGFLAKASSGSFHIVSNFAKTLPDFQDLVLMAKLPTLKAHRAEFVRFTEALLVAQQDLFNNESSAVAEYRKYNPQISPSIAQAAYKDFTQNNVWALHGGLQAKYLNYTVNALVKDHHLTHPLTTSQAYDASILKAAQTAVKP